MDLIVALFSPFILLGIIVIAFCGMAGIKPDTVLRPLFQLAIELIKFSFHAVVMIIRLISSSSTHVPQYRDYLQKHSNQASTVDPSRIRVVVLDDED